MAIRINGKDNASTLTSATSNPMSTYHLANNPNLFEVQRKNNFEFIVTDIDGIAKAGLSGSSISNAQEILRVAVNEAFVPHFSQNVIQLHRGNNVINYAGVPEFKSGTIKFNDYIGASAKEVLMAWQALSYSTVTQKVGIATDYKKDCYLCEYSPDYQLVRKWKLHGCWISELSEDSYSSDQNDVQQVSATITYDWAEIDVSGIE